MKITSVSIKNFRGIGGDLPILDFKDLNLFIGNNGTSKTAILEAINLCLSSNYAASRLSIEDFYLGGDGPIEIKIFFESIFKVEIPDGFTKQQIDCNGIALIVKKRDRSAPGKAFNDLVVVEHYYSPTQTRGEEGWTITRASGTDFKISERHLALSFASAESPKSFYFGKNRDKQLRKGFSSSLSNVLDDLNWRFEKGQRGKPEEEKFKHVKKGFEKNIFDNTQGDTLKNTIYKTNESLKRFNIPAVDLSMIRTLTPYDGAMIVKQFDGFELPIDLTGSGIEMITSVIFLVTLAKISKNKICIIIDEPELHLHPTLQDTLALFLKDISSESQVFISTHSPFFFKNCFTYENVRTLVAEIVNGKLTITNASNKGFGLLKWGPSWGEICYFAYGIPTLEFHDDLYAALQDKFGFERVADIETWFVSRGEKKEIRWQEPTKGPQEETLMTYIRNKIHHGDNQNRPNYSPKQLIESIKRMVNLLKPI